MYPLWVVTVFISLMAFYSVQDIPRRENELIQTRADVDATNFLAYRKALQKYVAANPGATGTIDDSTLAPYWLPGYVRNPNWTNVISGGSLFVHTTTSAGSNTLKQLYLKTGKSFLVGTKSSSTGRMVNTSGFDTGINLPASIPNESIVMMGM